MHTDSATPADQAPDKLPAPKSRFGYTAEEAAEILGIHRNTVYEWVKAGELKSRRKRRTHYFTEAELLAQLDPEAVAS